MKISKPHYVTGVLVTLLLTAARAHAQSADAALPRVRVTAPALADHRLIGQLLSQDESSITLAIKGKATTVPRGAVTQLEVSHHRSWRGHGALIGGLAGGAAGLILGESDSGCGSNASFRAALGFSGSLDCIGDIDLTIPGAIVLGAGGAVLGALVAPGEKWTPMDVHGARIGVTPLVGRRRGLALAVSF